VIAPELHLHVEAESIAAPEVVDLHGMIDDEIDVLVADAPSVQVAQHGLEQDAEADR
jgi:hypothetical protein